MIVILNEAKNLMDSSTYTFEILRPAWGGLRMTMKDSLLKDICK